MLRKSLRGLGPLASVALFSLGSLLVLFLSRLVLVLLYLPRLREVDGFLWLFPIGLRMDASLVSIVVFVPTVLLLVLPEAGSRWWKPLVAAYLAFAGAFVVFMEVATLPFLAQYDSRPNRLFIDYLPLLHGCHAAPAALQPRHRARGEPRRRIRR